jgi:hypothetical protein
MIVKGQLTRDGTRSLFQPIPFSGRVEKFWLDFKALEKPIRESFASPGSVVPRENEKVSTLLDDLFRHETSFSIYKNHGSDAINFDISPQGDDVIKILGQHVMRHCPVMDGWSFAPCHRPRDASRFLSFDGKDIDVSTITFHPSIDDERKKIDVVLESDIFACMNENRRFNVAFLLLDRLVGENVVEDRVGNISFETGKKPGSIPILSIREFIDEVTRENGWEPLTGDAGFVYWNETRDPDADAPLYRSRRDDVIVGSTKYPKLLDDYFSGKHVRTEQFNDTGADFIYAMIDQSEMRKPDPGQTDANLAWSVHDDVNRAGSAIIIGHAIGKKHTHFDIVNFGGKRSIVTLDAVLKECLQARRVCYGFFRASLGDTFFEINGNDISTFEVEW